MQGAEILTCEKKRINKSCRHPHEFICRKYCFNKEGVKKLFDKREGLTINRRIDNKVQCPAEMHVRLCLLPRRSFWVVTKFADSHSHNLLSLDNVHRFYSHQTHRFKMSEAL